jgi:hypothetical protein
MHSSPSADTTLLFYRVCRFLALKLLKVNERVVSRLQNPVTSGVYGFQYRLYKSGETRLCYIRYEQDFRVCAESVNRRLRAD